MASYQEEIAAWRVQRQQQEISNRLEQIKTEYAEAQRERDRAIADNDMETAECRDYDCQQMEQEWNQYVPPQPQYHPKDVKLMQVNNPYFRRYGQKGAQAAYAVNNHITQRMGVSPDHPNYEALMKSSMELYAKDFGAPYDPNSELLTADEAAKISGLNPQTYNQAYAQLKRQGRVR
jgi:hypothetical protein